MSEEHTREEEFRFRSQSARACVAPKSRQARQFPQRTTFLCRRATVEHKRISLHIYDDYYFATYDDRNFHYRCVFYRQNHDKSLGNEIKQK